MINQKGFDQVKLHPVVGESAIASLLLGHLCRRTLFQELLRSYRFEVALTWFLYVFMIEHVG